MRARRSLQRQLVWLVATFFLAVMLLLMLASAQEDSLTFDEPAHIAAGYASLRYRDARLNHEHPPLVERRIMASGRRRASSFMNPATTPTTSPLWHAWDPWP
jgi:hypothetical protein